MFRFYLYRHLFPEGRDGPGLSRVNKFICALIVLASFVAIMETEVLFYESFPFLFDGLEIFFVTVFIIEYCARLYAAGEDFRYRGFLGRIRYIFTWWSIIDLLAILPSLLGFLSHNALLLRLIKVCRLLRLSRLGRFSNAWAALEQAMRSRSQELLLSAGVAGLLLLFSSALLYAVEAEMQPETFGSVPRTLWWSIATLTTVGYGDVTPVTALGKFFAGITAVAGIGLIAMPTGILAAAFSEAFQKPEKKEN